MQRGSRAKRKTACTFCFYVSNGFALTGTVVTISCVRSLKPIFNIQAYDQHLNMILGEVEETVTTTEVDEETDEEIVKKQTRQIGMLFVRGDIVVLVSPPLRTT